jgi:hypothetical protein
MDRWDRALKIVAVVMWLAVLSVWAAYMVFDWPW